MIETVLVLPTPRALLPPAPLSDPVAELRAACVAAVERLPQGPVVVLASPVGPADAGRGITVPLGHRVAAQLLGDRSFEPQLALPGVAAAVLELATETSPPTTLLVMADGSARRGEKAPGHLHPDSVAFDDRVESALRAGDTETLAALDPGIGEELWCDGIPGLRVLGKVARGLSVTAEVTYADAPYGVAWWVARWDLTS